MKEIVERIVCDGCGDDISNAIDPITITGGNSCIHPRKGTGYVYTREPRHYCIPCGVNMVEALGIR